MTTLRLIALCSSALLLTAVGCSSTDSGGPSSALPSNGGAGGATAANGGAGGTGGATAANSGAGGTTGTTGGAGGVAEAGAVPDAGGAGGAANDAAATPSPADLLKTCSFANACSFGPVVTAPVQACVMRIGQYRANPETVSAEDKQVIERLIACAGTASTCADFTKCGKMNTTCTATGKSCSNEIAVECSYAGDNVPKVMDCAALGLTCKAGLCVDSAVACDASAAPWKDNTYGCDQNRIVTCTGDIFTPAGIVAVQKSCGPSQVCVPGAGTSSSYCNPNLSAYTTCSPDGVTCDGDKLTVCSGGHGMVSDCALRGMKCGAPNVDCVAAGTECTDNSPASACDGNTISSCVNGHKVSINCSDYGMTTCKVVTVMPICQ